jgi:hypothetical protein
MKFRTPLALLSLALTPAFGQGAPPASDLPPLVVTGRAQDLTGIAQSASQGRVGVRELEERPWLRPGEILEVVPGFILTQHSGTGKANQYFLRGFNLDHGTDFAGSVDGVPWNLPTHGHGQGYLDLNPVIPEFISEVLYRKGPYFADVGDFSSAGAADLRTVDFLERNFLKLGVGEDGFRRGVLGLSQATAAGRLTLGLEGQGYDGPWVHPENLRKGSGFLKLYRGDRRTGSSLTLSGYAAEWDATDQIPARAIADGRVSRLGSLDPTTGGESSRATLNGRGWRENGEVRDEVSAYLAYYDLNLWSNFTYFLDDPDRGDQFEQEDRRVYGGGEFRRAWKAEAGGLAWENQAGLQVRHDHIPDVGLYRTQARRRHATVRADAVEETALGLFGESTQRWNDALRTTLGLRGDAYFFDVESDRAENSGTADDQQLSPKASVIWSPAEKTEFYLSGGFGLHSNDARGTTITRDPASGEPAEPVDPLVRSRGAEVGLRTTAVPGLHSTLALWTLRLDSELLFVGDAGATEASRPSAREGVEWANFWRWNDWLTLDADLAATRARFRDDAPEGDHIPGALETVAAAGISVRAPGGWFGALRLRHFAGRPLIEDDRVRSDDSTVFNFQAGWRGKRTAVQLDVLNLFDAGDHDIEYFYASRLAGEPAEGIEDRHLHPLEPRTARIYLTRWFD